VVVRPARIDEVPLLGPIERDADSRFATTGHLELVSGDGIPAHVAMAAVDDGRLTVAEADGAVIGWLFATRVGGELSLGQVSVLPEHGQRGIGTALLLDLIDRARSMGEGSIVLNTQADVPWNMPWYARYGFVVVPFEDWSPGMHEVTDYQRADGLDWATRVHMRLRLD
jgi:GNAT superfamily N-acetyltransferase